jgi:ribonuclease PH
VILFIQYYVFAPFSEAEFAAMLSLTKKGVAQLHELQKQALSGN